MSKAHTKQMASRLLAITVIAMLAACGGGGDDDVNSASFMPASGDKSSLTLDLVPLNTRYVQAKNSGYWISETEVTYALWKKVFDWATTDTGGSTRADGGPLYHFQNAGGQGGHVDSGCNGTATTPQHPVTCISWRDAIVWTNALNEYINSVKGTDFSPAYSKGIASAPIRDSRCGEFYCTTVNSFKGSFDNPHLRPNATGFRLPTSGEWRMAAQYIGDANNDGDLLDVGEFYPLNFASGADADYSVTSGGADYDGDGDIEYTGYVAVFASPSTAAVGSRSPNMLGLYDMSGNVGEFGFDWFSYFPPGRVVTGGSWSDFAFNMQISDYSWQEPFSISSRTGFRLVRRHETTPITGDVEIIGGGTTEFRMRYMSPMRFPTRINDTGVGVVDKSYWIAETEVTYEMWSKIRTWAVANGYSFANIGHQGGDSTDCGSAPFGNYLHPVTCINWRDAIVWLNALTEWYNVMTGASLDYVYTSDAGYTTPLRNSTDGSFSSATDYPNPGSLDDPYINPSAKGFRLPSHFEWELAARYIDDANGDGDILDAGEFYPGNFASGADADIGNYIETSQVAWYGSNATYGPGNATSTRTVAFKNRNALGLYDMSGNVSEWSVSGLWNADVTFDRKTLGGSWYHGAERLQVGASASLAPFREDPQIGFRIARSE